MKAVLFAVILLVSLIEKGMSVQVMTQHTIIKFLVRVQVLYNNQAVTEFKVYIAVNYTRPSTFHYVAPYYRAASQVSVVKDYSMNGDLLALGTVLPRGRIRRLFLLNTSTPMTLVFTLAQYTMDLDAAEMQVLISVHVSGK